MSPPLPARLLGAGLLLLVGTSCGDRAVNPSPARTSEHAGSSLAPAVLHGGAPGSVRIISRFPDSTGTRGALFEELDAGTTGIDFVNPIDNDHPLSRLYIDGFASGGVAVGDVDGDGLVDLYLTRGPGRNALFRQTAPFRFEDITARAGLALGDVWSSGASFADVNGDGRLDLHVCVYDAPNKLFVNDGRGRFRDLAEEAGVAVKDASLMAHFQDYDADGDLDFYLLTNRLYRAGGLPTGKSTRRIDGKLELLPQYRRYYRLEHKGRRNYVVATKGRPDRLFENDGTGKFADVTAQAGIAGDSYGLSATWLDYDGDGDPDLYVANDFNDPDRLYQNRGDGTFRDVIGETVPYTPWFSMGSDAADMNNDGFVDLIVLDMSSTTHYKEKLNMGDMSKHRRFMDYAEPRQLMRNIYFINSGSGRFLEAAHLSGLSSSDWSWAVKLADFDNDSWTDVFITNGMTAELTNADLGRDQLRYLGREEWSYLKDEPRRTEPNMAFRNRDGLRFDKVAADWGLHHDGMSYAAAWADFDKDGHLDLIVANLDENVSLYRNRGNANRRLLVSLEGTDKNLHGIGAKVTARAGSLTQTRVLNPATGYLSSNEPILHFGFGHAPVVDELTITWPSGTEQILAGLETNAHLLIAEPKQSVTRKVARTQTMFVPLAQSNLARHTETPYDDFSHQPLLPNKLSQLGPGIAVEDLDGDGDEDFVVGAARGEKPHAHFTEEGRHFYGHFTAAEPETLCEDMAPLLFDADGDGDLDWFVVSGGVEHGDDRALLRDRLYVQVARGRFQRATSALPDITFSGSGAAAADPDRDGDLDLVIAGRVIPGHYPLSPGSVLLRNDTTVPDEPKFSDVTDTWAPGLRHLEMATSALWSDIDGDGWVDLFITSDWGPIRVFRNRRGRLEDFTAEAGLADFRGWWNGIAGRDLDNDGDVDYVATNLGGNTKYHPTPEHPSRIYYGAFGGDGRPKIVEAKVIGEAVLPLRGKSCSQDAMPFLRQKFPTYHDFASASLTEIYTDTALNRAQLFEVNTVSSAILLNSGSGHFKLVPLPDLAQIAPGFGVVATEVDGDGNADIYLVQNFFTPQRETGKMAGGLSLLLLGDGKGHFQPVWPNQSGLLLPGDAKGLATADFNADGWVDFAASVNDGRPKLFQNQLGTSSSSSHRPLAITLVGTKANSKAIGARVTVTSKAGRRQMAEVHAGGSYLSQSSNTLFFANPADDPAAKVAVRWPDGSSSRHAIAAAPRLVITQPAP